MRYDTGSALLNELSATHDEIVARYWAPGLNPGAVLAIKPRAPQCSLQKLVPPLPKPNIKPLKDRLAEADEISRDLPLDSRRKIRGAILGSAADMGELELEREPEREPLPRIAVPGKPAIAEIQKLVAHYGNVSRDDILSARRLSSAMRARHIAMYLSRLLTPRTLSEIGRRFGGKHHTTVIHAVRKITRLIETDEALAEEISVLKELLRLKEATHGIEEERAG